MVEMKYWRHGISYKFALLDKVKIRSFGTFAIKKIGTSKLGKTYKIGKRKN